MPKKYPKIVRDRIGVSKRNSPDRKPSDVDLSQGWGWIGDIFVHRSGPGLLSVFVHRPNEKKILVTFQFFSRWINNVGRFCGSVISSSSCVLPGKKTRFRSVSFLECLHPTKLIIMFPNAQVSNHLDECLCSCG